MVEFICEGCGLHIVQVVGDTPPPQLLCLTCTFICEHYGAEGMAVYDHIHGRTPKKTVATDPGAG